MAVLLLGAAGLLALLPWDVVPEDGLVPLRLPLDASARVEAGGRFVATWADFHDVALVFPARIDDRALDQVVERALDIYAPGTLPAFDLEWRVLQGAAQVASGSGRQGARGGVREPGGERKVLFGDFAAHAGRSYELRVTIGASLRPLAREAIALEVRTANTARISHLRTKRRLNGVAAGTATLLGIGFLAAALRARARAPTSSAPPAPAGRP